MNKRKRTLLIADDDPLSMRNLLKSLIAQRRDHYEARVCIDGLEAIEIMEERRVDCLILDLDMPNLNGIETLQEMKKRGLLVQIPVIVSSGHIDESMREQIASFGVTSCLQKPYVMDEIIQRIDAIMLNAARC
jgi:CheY-like chemotaxis protein